METDVTDARPRQKLPDWAVVTLVVLCFVVVAYLLLGVMNCPAWRYNEAAASSVVKQYSAAQVHFSVSKFAAIPGNTSPGFPENGYADNFRNLYYGKNDKGEQLQLIYKRIADAFLKDNALGGTPTPPEAPIVAVPYRGYYYVEDMFGMLPASGYAETFAFMAFPASYGIDGYRVFWIDDTGMVKSHDPKAARGTPALELAKLFYPPTPLSDNPMVKWKDE